MMAQHDPAGGPETVKGLVRRAPADSLVGKLERIANWPADPADGSLFRCRHLRYESDLHSDQWFCILGEPGCVVCFECLPPVYQVALRQPRVQLVRSCTNCGEFRQITTVAQVFNSWGSRALALVCGPCASEQVAEHITVPLRTGS